MILKETGKDLFEAAVIIEMKTIIKGITMTTEILTGQEMNFGNHQEVLVEDHVHLEVVAVNLKEAIMSKKVVDQGIVVDLQSWMIDMAGKKIFIFKISGTWGAHRN